MGKNDTSITLSAELDIQESIATINKNIKTIEGKLNKLIVSAKLDKQTVKEIKSLTQSLTQLQRITEQLQNKNISISPKDDGINKILDKLDQLNTSITTLKENNLVIDTKQTENNLVSIDDSLKDVKGASEDAGKSLKDMLSSAGINISTYQAIRLLKQAIKEVGDAVDDYNKYHTNLRIITGADNSAVDRMLEGYTEESIKLGVDISEYESAAEAILRTGKNAAETNMILKDSVVLSKTGFIDSEKAANNLITIANAYNMEADAIENVTDKILSLDVASQTEGGALSTAVARTAKNAQLAGVTIDSLAAQIANLRDVTGKEEEQIATSLNSIYSRMYNVKLGKFIIEDESGVDDITEDISDMEKILKRVDIQLRDSKGTFRDFDDIIRDLHNNWSKFNEVEKSAIGKTIGGTYHRNVALAMIQDYEDFQKLQDISLNSAGTAASRYQAYTESIEAKSAQLNTALKKMWADTIDNEFVTDIKGATAEVVEFIDKYEVLQNLMKSAVIYAAAKGFVYLGGTVKDAYMRFNALSQAFNSLSLMKNNAQGTTAYQNALAGLISYSQDLSDSQIKLLFSTKQLSEAQMMQILQLRGLSQEEAATQLATMGLTAAEGNATTATFTLSGAFKTLGAAIAANPIGAAATAIMALLSVFSIVKRKQEEAEEAERQLQAQVEKNIQTYQSEEATLDDLIAKYSQLASSNKDTAKVRDELSKLQSEVISQYGSEAEVIDLVNGKYAEQIEALYELKRAKAEEFINDADNIQAYKNALDTLNNAGDINGNIDVNVAYRGGISDDILDKWKEMQLISDSLQYSMSSRDYGFTIENGNNAEVLYKTLEQMADSYKELSTAVGEFNEDQYTAIKQQAIAAKEAYNQSKSIINLFENNKSIAEFALTGEEKQQFDSLLEKANELNMILNGDVSTVEKYDTVQKLSEVKAELKEIVKDNSELSALIDENFSVIEDGFSSSVASVSNLKAAWFETLDEMQKGSLKTIDTMKSALQTIAGGGTLTSEEFWSLAEIDTGRILDGAKLVDGQFKVTEEQLIRLKDEYIKKEIESLEIKNAELETEKRKSDEIIKQTQLEIQSIGRKGLSNNAYRDEYEKMNNQLQQAKKNSEEYGETISRNNLLMQQLNGSLGNTVDKQKAATELAKKAQDNVNNYAKAMTTAVQNVIDGLNDEKEQLENEKEVLNDQLDILNEQKDAVEEIIDQYKSIIDVVQEVNEAEIEALEARQEAEEKAIQAKIDALKEQHEQQEEDTSLDEKELDLRKKLADLEKAKNTKVRTYSEERGWHFDVDREAVANAQAEAVEAQKAYDKAIGDKAYNDQIKALEAEKQAVTDNYQAQIEAQKAYFEQWSEIVDEQSKAESEQLAEQILGSEWREDIKSKDTEILSKFRANFKSYNSQLNNLVNNEIASLQKSIKAKEDEINAKSKQIKSLQDYKNQVQDTIDTISGKYDEYVQLLNNINISESDSYDTRINKLSTFATEFESLVDDLHGYQSQIDDINISVNISTGKARDDMAQFIEDYKEAVESMSQALEESSTGYGVVNSDWDARLAEAANRMKRGYATGGTVDYTGVAMVHGTKQKSETIFNANDSAKLYDMIHNTPNLMADMMDKAVKISKPTIASNNTTNNPIFNIHNMEINGVQNPKEFTEAFNRNIEAYWNKKLTESYVK